MRKLEGKLYDSCFGYKTYYLQFYAIMLLSCCCCCISNYCYIIFLPLLSGNKKYKSKTFEFGMNFPTRCK